MSPGDIVVVRLPGKPLDGLLAIVEEVKAWGVVAYVQLPPDTKAPLVFLVPEDRAYVRLGHDGGYTETGGKITPTTGD